MKRKIGIYIVLIAIIIGAAPYLAGFLVETRFKDVVQVASEIESAKIEVVEYNRGWRTSTAQTRVTFQGKFIEGFYQGLAESSQSNKAERPQSLSILINHDIRHGPFVQLKDGDYADWTFALATIRSDLSLSDEAKKQIMAVIGDTKLFTMNSEIKIDGTTKGKIVGTELKIEDNATEHVLWKGMNGDWELSRDFKRLQCNMLMPGFDIYFENNRVMGEDLVFKTERFKTPEGLWLGNAKIDMQKFQVDTDKKPVFILTGFAASGVNDAENGMIESSGSLRVETFTFDNKQYGPANYSGSVKNISPGVMKSFMDISKKMEDQSEVNQKQNVDELVALVPELLKSRPELQIDDFSVRTQQGELKSFFHMAIGGPEAADIQNPQQIIQSIDAKGNLNWPKAMLQELLKLSIGEQMKAGFANQNPVPSEEAQDQEVAKTVDGLISSQVQEGLWVEKGTDLFMEFEFNNGQLKVNGKPLDLLKMMFEAKTQATQAAPAQPSTPGVTPPAVEGGTSSTTAQ